MLFFDLYKIIFSLLCFLIYNNVYPKHYQSYVKGLPMTLEILSLKTITNELDFLKKAVIIQ